jgi:hypothetical protein
VSRAYEADDSPTYKLVSSGYDENSHYYLYYLGYIKNVPVTYKTSYRYEGKTPMTFTFETTSATEDSVTASTTETVEHATKFAIGGTITVGVEAEAGAIFAKTKVTGSVAVTIGGEWSDSISTANTLETARSRTSGETQSITVTIGEHGEEAGTYRYALFCVTDVYILFEVDKTTRAVKEATFTTCARPDSYAWGIDFAPNGEGFGKTGGGEQFEIPDIDFTTVPAPAEDEEEENPIIVEYRKTSKNISIGTEDGAGPNDNFSEYVQVGGTVGLGGIPTGTDVDWRFVVKDLTLKGLRESGPDKGTYESLEISFSCELRYEGSAFLGGGVYQVWVDSTHTENLSTQKVVNVTSKPQSLKDEIRFKSKDTWVWADDLPAKGNNLVQSLKMSVPKIKFEAELLLEFEELP